MCFLAEQLTSPSAAGLTRFELLGTHAAFPGAINHRAVKRKGVVIETQEDLGEELGVLDDVF